MSAGVEIAVVIPCCNYGRFLGECLESVLAQTARPADLVVVDYGSTDETAEVARRYAPTVRYVYRVGEGVPVALNYGIECTTAPWIMLLGADDVLAPECLQVLGESAASCPGGAVVFGMARPFDSETGEALPLRAEWRERIEQIPHEKRQGDIYRFTESIFSAMLRGSFIPHCSTIVKREAFDRLGRYDETLATTQDYDMWLRLSRELDFVYVGKVLSGMRRHGQNLTCSIFGALRMVNGYAIGAKVLEEHPGISEDDRAFVVDRLRTMSLALARHFLGDGDKKEARRYIRAYGKWSGRMMGSGALLLASLMPCCALRAGKGVLNSVRRVLGRRGGQQNTNAG